MIDVRSNINNMQFVLLKFICKIKSKWRTGWKQKNYLTTGMGALLLTSPSVSQWSNVEQACGQWNTGVWCLTQPTLFPERIVVEGSATMGLTTQVSTLVTCHDVLSVKHIVTLLFFTCDTCVSECTLACNERFDDITWYENDSALTSKIT